MIVGPRPLVFVQSKSIKGDCESNNQTAYAVDDCAFETSGIYPVTVVNSFNSYKHITSCDKHTACDLFIFSELVYVTRSSPTAPNTESVLIHKVTNTDQT